MSLRAARLLVLAAAAAAADPVLLLHLDGDATDASGRGHVGVAIGDARFDGGRWGGGLLLDGGDGAVVVGDAPDLAITGELTVAAWVRVDDPTADSWMRIVSKKAAFDAHAGYELEYNPVQRMITLDAGDGAFLRSRAIDLDAGWHHVCATVRGTVGTISVDGLRVAGGAVGALAAGHDDLYVGRTADGAARFVGAIDEVRVDARALSAAEIWSLVHAPFRTVGAWSFGEGAGAIAHDASGLANDGVIDGATWTTGLFGGALAFAEPAVVAVGARASLALTGQLTVLAVVRVADPGEASWMRIVSTKTDYADAAGYELEYNPARAELGLIGGGDAVALAEHVALGTGWHLLIGVIDGRDGRLLVDGIDRTTAREVGPLRAGTTPFAIGRVGGAPTSYWHGAIDDLRVLNWALLPARHAPLAGGAPIGAG